METMTPVARHLPGPGPDRPRQAPGGRPRPAGAADGRARGRRRPPAHLRPRCRPPPPTPPDPGLAPRARASDLAWPALPATLDNTGSAGERRAGRRPAAEHDSTGRRSRTAAAHATGRGWCAGHRGHRLHRRPAGPRAARGGLPGALPGPPTPSGCATAPWSDQVEVVARRRSATRRRSARPLDGVEVAYYLVHSLGQRTDFESTATADGAETSAQAAREAGVGRIVYLGGPQPREERVSPHLASRQGGRRDPARAPACRPRCCGPR